MQKDAETKSGSGIKEASQGIGVDALEIPGGVIERENLNGMFARLWRHLNKSELPKTGWEGIVCLVRESNNLPLCSSGYTGLVVGDEIASFLVVESGIKYHWSWIPEVIPKCAHKELLLELRTLNGQVECRQVTPLDSTYGGILGVELTLVKAKGRGRWLNVSNPDPKILLPTRTNRPYTFNRLKPSGSRPFRGFTGLSASSQPFFPISRPTNRDNWANLGTPRKLEMDSAKDFNPSPNLSITSGGRMRSSPRMNSNTKGSDHIIFSPKVRYPGFSTPLGGRARENSESEEEACNLSKSPRESPVLFKETTPVAPTTIPTGPVKSIGEALGPKIPSKPFEGMNTNSKPKLLRNRKGDEEEFLNLDKLKISLDFLGD